MARAVPLWVGKTDNTAIPDRVRDRVFTKANGCCTICTRKLRAGEKWTLEHVTALINWLATELQPHGNRESNLSVTCENCLPDKNAIDVAEKSRAYKSRLKQVLPRKAKSAFGGFRKAPPGFKYSWATKRMERI